MAKAGSLRLWKREGSAVSVHIDILRHSGLCLSVRNLRRVYTPLQAETMSALKSILSHVPSPVRCRELGSDLGFNPKNGHLKVSYIVVLARDTDLPPVTVVAR